MSTLQSIKEYCRIRLGFIGTVEYTPLDGNRDPLPVERFTVSAADVYDSTTDFPGPLDSGGRIIYSISGHSEIGSYRSSDIESVFVSFDCQHHDRQAADRMRDKAMSSLRAGRRARRLTGISDARIEGPLPVQVASFAMEILP